MLGRHLWTGAGLAFVAIGAVGAFLPLLPTVPFLLLAAFCFAKGNPAWEQRLLETDEEDSQAQDRECDADEKLTQFLQRAFKDQDLEHEDEDQDRQHVGRRGEQCLQAALDHIHAMMLP